LRRLVPLLRVKILWWQIRRHGRNLPQLRAQC
jgi:hypothetical protein